MKNFKITVQYDGGRYNGWQRQGNTSNTIQERFENVVSEMIGKKTEVFASGRTDAGVHASGQVINFRCETKCSGEDVKSYLNRYLPSDIRILSVSEVDERFHSRLNAVSKTYEYRIATEKPDVFMRKYVYAVNCKPDIEKMRSAASKFVGTHDFAGFSSLGRIKKSTVRTVNFLNVAELDGIITICINGSGFLYNMVRIISGTLLDIGKGKLEESVIDRVFDTKMRKEAGITLPACGLVLKEVFY